MLLKREAGSRTGFPVIYNLVNSLGKLNDILANPLGHKIMDMLFIQSCAAKPGLTNHWAAVNKCYQILLRKLQLVRKYLLLLFVMVFIIIFYDLFLKLKDTYFTH